MPVELDGPRLDPRSPPARALVVFLHGYGADGNDLIEIGRAWQGLLPQAAFVSPHAPEPCSQAPTGRQWFPLTFRDASERWIGCNKAAPVLEHFLDAELKRRNLAPSACRSSGIGHKASGTGSIRTGCGLGANFSLAVLPRCAPEAAEPTCPRLFLIRPA